MTRYLVKHMDNFNFTYLYQSQFHYTPCSTRAQYWKGEENR
jgi:hypothetical protein